MKFIKGGLVWALCLLSGSVFATDKMYGVVDFGYTDADFSEIVVEDFSYKLALGHEISRQWYVEAGYQSIFDDLEEVEGAKADALFISVLGKAGNRSGELFYRLGVLNVDVQGREFAVEGVCALGEVSGTDPSGNTLCTYDEGGVAGVLGVGFDFFVGLNSMVRLEAEHIRGQNGLSVNAVYLGLRYNFN